MGLSQQLKWASAWCREAKWESIVALAGLNLKTISDSAYAIVLFMTVVTTLFAPPILRFLFKKSADSH